MGHLELALMEILWRRGESTVGEVVGLLERPLAYTTVMTTLDRLYKKGTLERRKQDRAYSYAPRVTRVEWQRQRAGEALSAFLTGPMPAGELLISCLVDAVGKHDSALLDELERKIQAKREELERGCR